MDPILNKKQDNRKAMRMYTYTNFKEDRHLKRCG